MKKLGLVLAGGGGKGAYQIGVWKYLKEIGLDKKVSVVSGTSVGALNATLFASVPYEKAEYIWTREIEDKILKPKNLADVLFDTLPTSILNFTSASAIPSVSTISSLIRNGIWSKDGLIDIINKYVSFDKLKKMQQKVYATCCKVSSLEPKSFLINNEHPDTIRRILCATSAIPIAFKSEEINTNDNLWDFLGIGNDQYIDGGVVDNIPCSPAIEDGCSDIIVVNLSSEEQRGKYIQEGINYIGVTPSEDLGNLFDGTLDFSESGARYRIELGYNNCKNYYARFLDDLNCQKDFISIENSFNSHDDKVDEVFLKALKILSKNPEKLNLLGRPIYRQKLLDENQWETITECNNWKIQKHEKINSFRLLNPQKEECLHGLHMQLKRELRKLV